MSSYFTNNTNPSSSYSTASHEQYAPNGDHLSHATSGGSQPPSLPASCSVENGRSHHHHGLSSQYSGYHGHHHHHHHPSHHRYPLYPHYERLESRPPLDPASNAHPESSPSFGWSLPQTLPPNSSSSAQGVNASLSSYESSPANRTPPDITSLSHPSQCKMEQYNNYKINPLATQGPLDASQSSLVSPSPPIQHNMYGSGPGLGSPGPPGNNSNAMNTNSPLYPWMRSQFG